MDPIFTNPFSYVGLLGLIWGIYAAWQKRREESAKEAQSALQKKFDTLETKVNKHDSRITGVEDVDKSALPRFLDVEKTLIDVTNTVRNHHETRFTGIVGEMTALRDKFEYRFATHEKDIADIKKCFDKLETKMDTNTKDIMSAIMELNKQNKK